MVKVILVNEQINDLEEFKKFFPWILPHNYRGRTVGITEKELVITPLDGGSFRTRDSYLNFFKRLRFLEEENQALKAKLDAKKPKQNLAVYEEILPHIKAFREQKMSNQKIANLLNSLGVRNSRGQKFNKKLIERLMKRHYFDDTTQE